MDNSSDISYNILLNAIILKKLNIGKNSMKKRLSNRNIIIKLVKFINDSVENKDTSKAKTELSDKLLKTDDFIDAIESINPEIKRKLDDYNNLEKKYNTMKEELEDIKYKIFS